MEATGENAVKLAEVVYEASKNTDVELIVCPQAADIYRVREKFPELILWSQHIDPIQPGRNTGWTSPATIVMAGATGTLINHSEHKQALEEIRTSVGICKQLQLTSCVAANLLTEAQEIAKLEPDFLLFEPEELVSTGKSLVETDIERAKDFMTQMQGTNTKILLGAGVKNVPDIKMSLELGYQGVGLASGFINAENKSSYLNDLLSGFAR